jgi:DNA-binding beta-propeller fold protein YncE
MTSKTQNKGWFTLALAICATLAVAADVKGDLRVLERIEIGGQDVGYDYLRVDADRKRLFVAHGSHVEVLDTTSDKVIGQITDTPGVHGIALTSAFGHGFTSNGADRTVTMFDLATLKTLKVIKFAGVKPDAIEYDPKTRQIFVVDGAGTGDLTVIAPENGAIVATVTLNGGKLEELAFDGKGRGFVNDEKQSFVHVFDTRTLKPLASWDLSPGQAPTGLALDLVHHRLFAACRNKLLVVLNSDSGAVVTTVPIGANPDGAAFDPLRGFIFTSNNDGTLSVIRQDGADQYHVAQTVVTDSGARTIALNESSGRVYLPTAKFGPAPAPTAEMPNPRAPMLAASFALLVVGQ